MMDEIITGNAILPRKIKKSRVELKASKLEYSKLCERIASSAVANPIPVRPAKSEARVVNAASRGLSQLA